MNGDWDTLIGAVEMPEMPKSMALIDTVDGIRYGYTEAHVKAVAREYAKRVLALALALPPAVVPEPGARAG